jgi:hypothetical protein
MSDFLFLFVFLTALGGCVATRMLGKRQFHVQKNRDFDRRRRSAEYAYMEGVIDEQSHRVNLDAFHTRMAAWWARTSHREDLGEESAALRPLRDAPNKSATTHVQVDSS